MDNLSNLYSKETKQALVILGRYPHPGRVKTRLAKDLGANEAARVYREIVEKLLNEVKDLQGVGVYFCYADLSDKKLVRKWITDGVELIDSVSSNIEENISNAFEGLFRQGFERVMCVGSDIPDLDSGIITRAFESLKNSDVVIGQDLSGGIYLFGLKKFESEFFSSRDTSLEVFEKTIKLCAEKRLKYCLLQKLLDIDTLEDYNKYYAAKK